MNENAELPDRVLTTLRQGRKIEAIKLLREQEGLGLKEAKERIDSYAAAHPESLPRRKQGQLNLVPLLLAAAIVAAAYIAFELM